MDVQMPDGTVIQGVPEGTTKADLQAKYDAHTNGQGGGDSQSGLGQFMDTVGKNASDLLDVVAGFPSYVAKMGARGAVDAGFAVASKMAGDGASAEDIMKASSQYVDDAMSAPWNKFLAHPLHTIAEATGADKQMKDSAVADAMGWVGDAVQKAGAAVGLSPEETARVGDIVMTKTPEFLVDKGLPWVKKQITNGLRNDNPGAISTTNGKQDGVPPQTIPADASTPPSSAPIPDIRTMPLPDSAPREPKPAPPTEEERLAEWNPPEGAKQQQDTAEQAKAQLQEDLETARQAGEARTASTVTPSPQTSAEITKLMGGKADPKLLAGLAAAGGIAAYVAANPQDRQRVFAGLGLAGLGLSMKAKGGNWHPEAAAELARGMKESFGTHGYDANDVNAAQGAWADKAVTTYLNRHAGTATDPLKDVKIPFGETEATWGSLTDNALKGFKGGTLGGDRMGATRLGGTVYGLRRATTEQPAIKSYLSHVADFLKQTVPVEKLGQYDLVRAVKETAANDERVAKMQGIWGKARTAELPTIHDLGDGWEMKEIKIPEGGLTPKHLKGVRTTDAEEGVYQPITEAGKPLYNNYQDMYVIEDTPEKAWLAGHLAEEGNLLKHCTGGYCKKVASGQSRILSLRKNGRAVGTIEMSASQGFKEDPYFDIRQIKGWENGAIENEAKSPGSAGGVAKLLEWLNENADKIREVGDLPLQKLEDTKGPEFGSGPVGEYIRKHASGRFITTAEAARLVREGVKSKFDAPKQSGKADPHWLAGLAAAGIGATAYLAMNPDDRQKALAGLGLVGMALVTKGEGTPKFESDGFGGVRPYGVGKSLDKAMPTTEMPKVTESLTTPRGVAQAFPKAVMNGVADTVEKNQYMSAAANDGITEDIARGFHDYSQAVAAGETPKVAPGFKAAYDKWAAPLQERINKVWADLGEGAAKEVAQDFSNRIAIWKTALSDVLSEKQGQAGGPGGFGRKPGAEKSRSVFSIGGKIVTVKRTDRGYQVTEWEDNVPKVLGHSPDKVVAGGEFWGKKVEEAQTKDIEANTPIKYLGNDLAIKYMTLNALEKAKRERDLIKGMSDTGAANGWMHPADKVSSDSEGFRRLNGATQAALPAFRDQLVDPRFAEVLEDFADRYKDSGLLDSFNNVVIRTMMINPYPHFRNEFAHWFIARGASGLLPFGQITGASRGLQGLMSTVADSVKSVLDQDGFQKRLMREGGYLLAPSVKNMVANKRLLELGIHDLMKDAAAKGTITALAKALGISFGTLLARVSDFMSTVMWSTRDMMYTQLVKEQMQMGKTMAQAIEEVGKHMPEYYVPSRVGEKLLGAKASRLASQAMQSRLLIFGRYHYGWLRSLGENAKEIAQVRRDTPAAVKGIDHMLGMALGGYLIYKGTNAAWTSAFGQPAEERMPGVYHGLQAAYDVATGKKDYSALLGSFLTLNPAISATTQILRNRDWAGKQIVPSGSTPGAAALRMGLYAGSQLSPVQGLERTAEGSTSTKGNLAALVDVKLTTMQKQYDQLVRQRENRERAAEATQRLEKQFGIGK